MKQMTGATEYSQLLEAMEKTAPACAGDPRYIDDETTAETRADLAATCRACPLRVLCGAYASKAKPTGGYWPTATQNRRNG